jgi:hypothetical protein
MVEARVREKDFNLQTWYATIPMTDDVYLGLQAQNIARVEISVMRRWEGEVLDEQEDDPGSYQGPKYRELMALSQMWVFGLYEFLRTWRQRARALMQFEEKCNKLATQAEREAYLEDLAAKAKDKTRRATRFPVYYPDHVAKIADSDFMKSLRAYWDKTDVLFGELSSVRMPAAKHELPKRRGQEALIADAPGMGLPDKATGSIRWHVLLGERQTTIVRRDLADKFFDILGWHEDIETALLLANEAKARRKTSRAADRDSDRGGERLDEFFRTKSEAARDKQPMHARAQDRTKREGVQGHGKDREEATGSKARQPMIIPQPEIPPDPVPYFVRKIGTDATKNGPDRLAKLRYPRNKK